MNVTYRIEQFTPEEGGWVERGTATTVSGADRVVNRLAKEQGVDSIGVPLLGETRVVPVDE